MLAGTKWSVTLSSGRLMAMPWFSWSGVCALASPQHARHSDLPCLY